MTKEQEPIDQSSLVFIRHTAQVAPFVFLHQMREDKKTLSHLRRELPDIRQDYMDLIEDRWVVGSMVGDLGAITTYHPSKKEPFACRLHQSILDMQYQLDYYEKLVANQEQVFEEGIPKYFQD